MGRGKDGDHQHHDHDNNGHDNVTAAHYTARRWWLSWYWHLRYALYCKEVHPVAINLKYEMELLEDFHGKAQQHRPGNRWLASLDQHLCSWQSDKLPIAHRRQLHPDTASSKCRRKIRNPQEELGRALKTLLGIYAKHLQAFSSGAPASSKILSLGEKFGCFELKKTGWKWKCACSRSIFPLVSQFLTLIDTVMSNNCSLIRKKIFF